VPLLHCLRRLKLGRISRDSSAKRLQIRRISFRAADL
jgi:hypothetical protein